MAPNKIRSTFAAGAFVLSATLGCGLHGETAHAESSRYEITPEPDWVRDMPAGSEAAAAEADASGGTANLLVDRQIHIQDGWSEYDRYVMRVVNPAGIGDASQVTIDFDPELDHLRIHSVTLRRGAETIDELKQGRTELLQRESRLEQAVLDGTLTFHLLMSDVRVGDVVDCRYTIEHHNPAWGNRFFGRVLVRWDDPVQRSRLRVLVRANAPLYFRAGGVGGPVLRRRDDWESLEWNWVRLPGVAAEADAPSWYEQYPAIQFSQFADWSQVVDAELPLFAVREGQSPELASIVAQLRSGSATDAGRVLAALRFVQEQVRYTGVEIGTGAYRPSPPNEVLRRRYGDCKEKALLTVTLLRALEIDAAPALVSSRWQHHLSDRLPSPADFDHAIVRVRLGHETYWVDPTLTAQGGRLESLVQADFGEALVIAPGVRQPEPISSAAPPWPLVASNAIFDLRAGFDHGAKLTVSTVYRGSAADELRRVLRRSSPAQLGMQYLNYYRTRYSDIRSQSAPDFRDDLAANEITVEESYVLAHPFEAASPGESQLALAADLIGEYLASPTRSVRTTPLSLHRHVHIAERITVRLPHPLPIDRSSVTIDAPAFRYQSRVSRAGNDMTFDFAYQALADDVPVDELESFLSKLDAARQDARLTLVYRDSQPRLTVGAAVGQVR